MTINIISFLNSAQSLGIKGKRINNFYFKYSCSLLFVRILMMSLLPANNTPLRWNWCPLCPVVWRERIPKPWMPHRTSGGGGGGGCAVS